MDGIRHGHCPGMTPLESFRREIARWGGILGVVQGVNPKMDRCDGLNGQLSNEKNPGCSGYIGDSTAQLYMDYNKPL